MVDLIIVQFREDFLGKEFTVLPETKNLHTLFRKAARGLKFSKPTSSLVHDQLIELPYTGGLPSIIHLLKVLDTLSKSEDCQFICSEGINVTFRENDQIRMSKVINYLTENYNKKITIEEMAAVSSMAPNAFCRFFRNKTDKSFTEYLNEIRIGNACKLLIEGKMQVSQISYLSGFGSLSNFNRKFKQVMGSTPSEYMQKYEHSIESV
jgi:AraC-like DNA-binding protein